HVDVGSAQAVVRRDRERNRRTDARQLFDADAVVDGRHRGPAVPFVELDARQPERGELRQQIHRELLRLVPLHHVRTDLGFGELAHATAQDLLLIRWAEVHSADYMDYHAPMRLTRLVVLSTALLLSTASAARADLTGFLGVTTTPTNRAAK